MHRHVGLHPVNPVPPTFVFPSFMDAVARYGTVIVGLLLGFIAKYGLALTDGKRVTWKTLLIDMSAVGALTVIVVTVSDWLGLTPNLKVAMGVMVGLSSDRLIRLARKKFEQYVAARVDAAMPPKPVPPTPAEARAEAVLPLVDGRLPPSNPEIDELLGKLG